MLRRVAQVLLDAMDRLAECPAAVAGVVDDDVGDHPGVALSGDRFVVVAWQISDLDEDVLEMFPGMIAAFSVYGGWRGLRSIRRRR